MDMRSLTSHYFVSPQITPEDLAKAKAAGITRIICNRPDAEVPPDVQAAAIGAAAEAAGLDFHVLELTHQTMTPENVAKQRDLIASSDGPVLAYCASGTRCSVIWALAHAGEMGIDAVLNRASKAGYQLEGLRPSLQVFVDRGL